MNDLRKLAKTCSRSCWSDGSEADAVIEARRPAQITDAGAIGNVIDDIMAANPAAGGLSLRQGQLFCFFVGQAMTATGGKATRRC